ncbi:MAG: FtsQ-type POTRA domain-containing protein [Microbacteriaceae bacterium]|nr:FtsQ-type POTRA domain-containing protein [Microbacteriaceae bacterium]
MRRPSAPGDKAASARSALKQAKAESRNATRARIRYEKQEAKRFTKEVRQRRIAVFSVIGFFVCLGLVMVIAIYTPLFAVRNIQILGTERIDPAQVVASLSHLEGVPLPQVENEMISEQLSDFKTVASFTISRELPNTLIVHIVERKEIAAVRIASGYELIDAAGVVLGESETRPNGIPEILVQNLSAEDIVFKEVMQVLLSFPQSLSEELVGITGTTKDNLTITLTTGQRVIWGDASQSELKNAVLEVLREANGNSRDLIYDVSAPNSPVVKQNTATN